MKWLIRIVINGVAIWATAALFDKITLGQNGQTGKNILTALLVGGIFAAVNTFVKPVVRLLSLPLVILTLGLFLLVVNALLLLFTSWLADQLNLPFHVSGFWTAVFGSIVISIIAWALSLFIKD